MNVTILLMLLSIAGAAVAGFGYGHEFGMVEGARYERMNANEKLQNCNRVLAGSIYGHP